MVHPKFLCVTISGCSEVAHKNKSCYKYQLSITYFSLCPYNRPQKRVSTTSHLDYGSNIFPLNYLGSIFTPYSKSWQKWPVGQLQLATSFFFFCIFCYLFFTFLNGWGENQTQKNKIYWWHVTIIWNSTVKFIGTHSHTHSFMHCLRLLLCHCGRAEWLQQE